MLENTEEAVEEVTLTKRQEEFLAYLHAYVAEHGVSPTLSEIAGGLDVKVGTVQHVLYQLIIKGKIKKVQSKQRGIELL